MSGPCRAVCAHEAHPQGLSAGPLRMVPHPESIRATPAGAPTPAFAKS